MWDSPRQREAYDWFTVELANLRTAFRWAADHGDLDVAAAIATYAAFLGFWVENYEPITWAEELIEPACAVNHPRLAALYVTAAQRCTTGRIEDLYMAIGQPQTVGRLLPGSARTWSRHPYFPNRITTTPHDPQQILLLNAEPDRTPTLPRLRTSHHQLPAVMH